MVCNKQANVIDGVSYESSNELDSLKNIHPMVGSRQKWRELLGQGREKAM
ncbi:hypothetical protein HORM4_180025 [Vibrio harveyi]|nr:hypothetical protein HORM4_180025 [Vibrio harveyi]